ncbi:hypothetical protein [Phaeodactylibacter sp.]|uniref:hypothetical protein n=1 Tax=Phaeodactylibacter sp. TaxID=1940289 RepID=UPI0025D3D6A0|nr:hypothetical protein [Phaeodactylibacter sp.]MCI4647551.1 hypothetical protein [Phaeodactylibacter sp.]MCI5093478.1 hypothetical protein [Phaeodactylibacter sp.]
MKPALNSRIELLGKAFPLLSVTLLAVAYLRIHEYYGYFNIKIERYIDASEIVFVFFPYLVNTLYYLSAALLMNLLIFSILEFELPEDQDDQKEYRQKSLKYYFSLLRLAKIKRLGFRRTIGVLVRLIRTLEIGGLFFLIGLSLFLDWVYQGECMTNLLSDYYIWLVFAWFIWIFAVIHKKQKRFQTLIDFTSLAIIIFVLILITNRRVDCEVTELLSNPSKASYEIKGSDFEILTDSTLLLVGMTRNYIFLYEKNEKETRILTRNAVEIYDINRKPVEEKPPAKKR